MTNRGGSLAKSVQNRLKKTMPSGERDPMAPPAVESLYYEILRGLRAIEANTDGGMIDLGAAESSLRRSAIVQSWHWVRAWLDARLWQDGIGVVPDRSNRPDSGGIPAETMHHAREALVWALCRVAHGSNDWLDLETFLADFWSATGEDAILFDWHIHLATRFRVRQRRRQLLAIPGGERIGDERECGRHAIQTLLPDWLSDRSARVRRNDSVFGSRTSERLFLGRPKRHR